VVIADWIQDDAVLKDINEVGGAAFVTGDSMAVDGGWIAG
jgi:hypothetical protein